MNASNKKGNQGSATDTMEYSGSFSSVGLSLSQNLGLESTYIIIVHLHFPNFDCLSPCPLTCKRKR